MSRPTHLKLTAEEVHAVLARAIPEPEANGWTFRIEYLEPRAARVRLPFDAGSLRPGGTISGPRLFHLADYTMWIMIIGMLGEPGVPAVTSDMSISFLRRPEARDVIATGRLVKLGRRLAVGSVELCSDGNPDMMALATATYALP